MTIDISEMPYGLRELREDRPLLVGKGQIRCHVRGCKVEIPIPSGSKWKRQAKNYCHHHRIFVHKSTYRYDDYFSNILTTVRETEVLESIRQIKVEQRWGYENSEDALMWNVFRTFEKAKRLVQLAKVLTANCIELVDPIEVILWGYHEGGVWEPLKKARVYFEQDRWPPTEPDLVLLSRSGLIFIEAKFGSPNKAKEKDIKRYEEGGLYKRFFNTRLSTIRYSQLVRHFIFAAYIAGQLGVSQFMLVNLVRRKSQSMPNNTSKYFGRDYLREPAQFRQATWEEVYENFMRPECLSPDLSLLKRYFENKTHNLLPAFDLSG